MTFDRLGLSRALLRAVQAAGYEQPTPIQAQAIPPALEGRDLLGCAQTGSGKTAAFSLPILQHVDEHAGDDPHLRALILTPTRELAMQIGESLETYGEGLDLWHTVIFGGVNQKPQVKELDEGVDILVATPGRLLDLMGQGLVHLDRIEIFVLDEADRMLDMGFLPDVRRVVEALPKKRQTLFFSATMPPPIRELAERMLEDPVWVAVTPVSSTVETIDQRVYFVAKRDKRRLLVEVLEDPKMEMDRTLVFSRTKHGANRIAQHLDKAGIRAAAIHGNKSQGARVRALEGFKDGSIPVLVATDLAARGLDVDGVTHVVNLDLPNVPETYVHRIGRTGRAGAAGIALSFCDGEERAYLKDIEKLIDLEIQRVVDHPYHDDSPDMSPPPKSRPAHGGGGRGRRGGGRRSGGGRGRRGRNSGARRSNDRG